MSHVDQINRAISAHGEWKTRIQLAIHSGKIDTTPELIYQDNLCTFGQWLYGDALSPHDKESSHYKRVKEIHTEFHKVASRVIKLALDGKRAEAEAMMAFRGEYTTLSSKLTQAMIAWRNDSIETP